MIVVSVTSLMFAYFIYTMKLDPRKNNMSALKFTFINLSAAETWVDHFPLKLRWKRVRSSSLAVTGSGVKTGQTVSRPPGVRSGSLAVTGSGVPWLVGSMTSWFPDWLVGLVGSLCGWLVGWVEWFRQWLDCLLVGWLGGRVPSMVGSLGGSWERQVMFLSLDLFLIVVRMWFLAKLESRTKHRVLFCMLSINSLLIVSYKNCSWRPWRLLLVFLLFEGHVLCYRKY